MSALGQNEKKLLRACVFRSVLELGHRSMQSAVAHLRARRPVLPGLEETWSLWLEIQSKLEPNLTLGEVNSSG
jgi:hypothetical protein